MNALTDTAVPAPELIPEDRDQQAAGCSSQGRADGESERGEPIDVHALQVDSIVQGSSRGLTEPFCSHSDTLAA